MPEETKATLVKCAFNLLMFVMGSLILFILMNDKCSGPTQQEIKRDTVIIMGQPVVNNYTVEKPTVYKEKTIEYQTGYTMTKSDSDLIVIDYLKSRQYTDTVGDDTVKQWYTATVEKNTLANIHLGQSYRPKILSITETITKEKNRFLIGLAPGWNNNFPTIAFYGSYDAKNFNVGLMYDAIRNPKGGYIILSKPIRVKK